MLTYISILSKFVFVVTLFMSQSSLSGYVEPCEQHYKQCKFIKKLKKDAETVVHFETNKEKAYKKLGEIVDTAIDKQSIVKFALGIHWRNISSLRKEEFTREYGKYIKCIYVKYLYQYANDKMSILSIKQSKSDVYLIKTRLTNESNSGDFVNLEFKISSSDNIYYVNDLKINGTISVSINQRNMIDDMVREKESKQTQGIDKVMAYLLQENSKKKC